MYSLNKKWDPQKFAFSIISCNKDVGIIMNLEEGVEKILWNFTNYFLDLIKINTLL